MHKLKMFGKTVQCILRNSNTKLIFQRFSSTTETAQLPDYETKLLRVAIIGTPNAGKSTFINNLMDRKVCATSSKVHTTRTKAKAIITCDDTQIVFVDTPGLVNDRDKKKFNLEKSFIKDSKSVFHNTDMIGVIHDVSDVWTREKLDIKIIKLLQTNPKLPSFLVLNKIDILKSKRKLLDITRQLTDNCLNGEQIPGNTKFKKEDTKIKGWRHFKEIFMVSALTGNGLEDIKNYLIKQAKPGKWMFPEQVWTDQDPEKIITNTVQARLLDFLPQEIPYNLKPEIEYFDIDEKGAITSAVNIIAPSERIAKLVAGASDGRLKQITESVQYDLQNTFQNHVRFKLVITPIKSV